MSSSSVLPLLGCEPEFTFVNDGRVPTACTTAVLLLTVTLLCFGASIFDFAWRTGIHKWDPASLVQDASPYVLPALSSAAILTVGGPMWFRRGPLRSLCFAAAVQIAVLTAALLVAAPAARTYLKVSIRFNSTGWHLERLHQCLL